MMIKHAKQQRDAIEQQRKPVLQIETSHLSIRASGAMSESTEKPEQIESKNECPETNGEDTPPLTSETETSQEAETGEETKVPNGESNGDVAAPSKSDEDEETKEKIPTDQILLHNLSKGFASLSRRRNSKHGPPVISERSVCSCATVNFIDPTSSLVAATPTSKFSILSPLSKQSAGQTKEAESASVDLYPKLTSILERDYQSTLHSVPYQNPRSGKQENIENLYIRSIVTKAHGVGDTYVPWGGTAATQASPVSDPAEWHNGPHCHVYIAACEGLEHYRQKVKPALQAFVSQIEGAAGSPTNPKDSGSSRNSSSSGTSSTGAPSGSYSAHYVIIYVPIGKRTAERSSSSPNVAPLDPGAASLATKRMGSLASRMRRQIQQASTPSNSDHGRSHSESALEARETVSAEMTVSDPSAAPPPGPIAHSSRVEKELYRKFTTDFPNGKTCIMTTLMEVLSENSVATTSPLKNQEWNNFLRMLGSAIVSGFNDRCRRYDEELRRLDALRAAARSPVRKNSNRKLTKPPKNPFDLSHFFLVKESLAFTYEQMQLPAEALLQYDELGAFVMEAVDLSENGVANMRGDEEESEENDYDGLARKRSSRKLTSVSNFSTAEDLAIAGDTVGFRRRLRSVQDLTPEVPLVLQYLYAREASLLFQLVAPVELIERSHVFIHTMYTMRIKGLGALAKKKKELLTREEQTRRRNEIEKWALRTCWDVKCASDTFFYPPFAMMKQLSEASFLEGARIENSSAEQYSDDGSSQGKRPPSQPGVQQMSVNPIHLEAACKLSELLEFARNRLLYLGDVELGSDNPIRSMFKGLPPDMRKSWSPWVSESVTERKKAVVGVNHNKTLTKSDHSETRWMDGMFDSPKQFESKYVELVGSVVKLCRLAGRRRIAARLQAERAEIHILRGEYELAEKALLPAVNICAEDRWDRGHFWRLFRLACCQRVCADPAAYLNTLTRCFGSEMSSVAPTKALKLLQQDLEAVVGNEEISKYHLGISPFLETDLTVEAASAANLVTPSGSLRKKVLKHFCSVGEKMGITLRITSHLPQAIYVDSIRLVMVAYDKYETIYASRGDVEEELVGAFQIIPFDPPTVVEPGDNEFKIDWVPMSTGQYILSTVEIQWKASCFFYRSCAMRKPLMEIDVVPSNPTQTVELNPLFLMPGHTQPVRITFKSGSDIITEGSVQLECSDGLEVIPPGSDPEDDEWGSSCKILIPPCGAGESVVLATSVRSTLRSNLSTEIDGDKVGRAEDSAVPASNGIVQTMVANVSTSYYHALFDKVKDSNDTATPMNTVLEAKVTTLDRPALTVDSANAFPYTSDQAIVKVSLHCNTPVPFFIKEWKVMFPEPMRVEDDGDLNADLYGHPISEGEALSFGFLCVYSKSPFELEVSDGEEDSGEESVLRVVLQDEFGKTFNQVLPLDLDSFYEQIRKEEEYNGTKGIPVELRCSTSEGLSGTPVTFTYHVDTSLIAKTPRRLSLSRSSEDIRLLYDISCDENDWIIGGKVQGILKCSERSSFDLEFVGIPTRPGVLKTFPSISVEYQSAEADAPPIMVHSELPESFTSFSILSNVSLAYPAILETA